LTVSHSLEQEREKARGEKARERGGRGEKEGGGGRWRGGGGEEPETAKLDVIYYGSERKVLYRLVNGRIYGWCDGLYLYIPSGYPLITAHTCID